MKGKEPGFTLVTSKKKAFEEGEGGNDEDDDDGRARLLQDGGSGIVRVEAAEAGIGVFR